jgi:beta-galactosidase
MVKRYRNSPSIIIWSIGNEEFTLQEPMAEQGAKIAASMVERCHELDPTRVVSAAVNGGNEKGPSLALDILGFNYNLKLPDAFHKAHPTRALFGSETSSAIATRGVYSTDPLRNTINSYDGVVPWGETAEEWWKFYGTRDWEAGGFAWTGFDYRGEPTPYDWPCVNSHFGILDMCGFPKDNYHYYQAWWIDKPSVHILPHWNWPGREGHDVDVWAYSNADRVELLLNGHSLGAKPMPRYGHVDWKVPYTPGRLEARAFTGDREVARDMVETAGAPARLRLTPDRKTMRADGEDVVMVGVAVLDAAGRVIPVADNEITFATTGAGRVAGVGNGDANSHEPSRAAKRRAFNGLCMAIVQADEHPGRVELTATSPGLPAARITLAVR